jgi:Derlin-2/3
MDVGDNLNGGFDVMSWYMSIPPVSRVYFTSAFLTTTCCAMELINPYHLYYNPALIFEGQVWRLFSPFLFFGLFSVDFLFNMYFLIRHCRQLEEGDFRGKPSEFIVMILFGILCICCIAPFLQMHNFLGNALTYMMTYVWGRRNEDVRMSMLGIITFTAPWLPWVMLTFGFLVGNSLEMSIVGIITGHIYYFLEFVIPVLAEARGWKTRKVLLVPSFLRYICGEYDRGGDVHLHMD